MTRQRSIIVLPNVKLNRIESHRAGDIRPSQPIPARVATLHQPPIAVVAVPTDGREMLHQQTCIDGDEDTWTEPGDVAEDAAGVVVILHGGFSGESAGAVLADCGDDAGGGVEDEDAIGEGYDD